MTDYENLLPNDRLDSLIVRLAAGSLAPADLPDLRAALLELQKRREGVNPAMQTTRLEEVSDRGGYTRQQVVVTYHPRCSICGNEFPHRRSAGRPKLICDECRGGAAYRERERQRVAAYRSRQK